MKDGGETFVLPNRMARRYQTARRLILAVVCTNFLLALIGAWFLNGPGAYLTRFRPGFAGWTAVLFFGSLVLTVPLLAAALRSILKPREPDAD